MTSDIPMSDERLAEIRASVESVRTQVHQALNPPPTIVDLREPETADVTVPVSTIFMAMNVLELLAEVERLRKLVTAL